MTTAMRWPEPPSSGWWFVIHPETATRRDRETVLASWYAQSEGIGWLRDLVNQGKATAAARSDNFHGTYTARLADVRPVLDAPPAFRSFFEHQHHPDRIATCTPDVGVVIDVWDQG